MRKSVAAFEAVTADGNTAYRWSTLCFFGGMVLVFILDRVSRRGSLRGSARCSSP